MDDKVRVYNDAKFHKFVEELQALRRDIDSAESKLLWKASDIEASVPASEWREFYGSFDNFLKKFNICDPAKYRTFLLANERKDVANVAEAIGVSATIQASKIDDAGRRHKYLEAAKIRVEEVGVPWSDQEAREQRIRIGGSAPVDSDWNKRASERDQLRLEVIRLKKEVQRLEIELAEAKEEAEALRKAGAKTRGRAIIAKK
jgi:hypothetical protein